jgi:hypothetical protein
MVRFEVGTSSGVDCVSLGQCLRFKGFVNCRFLLFCPPFCCVSMTFQVH